MAMSSGLDRACVLVLGMHRSGTSAMTRTIHAMGAALPSNLIDPSADNEEGFWESEEIVRIHNDFLVAVGHGWNDPRIPTQAMFDSPAAATCRAALMAILRRDFANETLFVIKDPRISLLMPMWGGLLEEFGAKPFVLLGFRHPDEVALSLVRRRDGFVDSANKAVAQHGRAVWLTHNLEAERHSRAMPRAVVSYDDFLADPARSTRSLAEGLGCFEAAQIAAGLDFAKTHWKSGMRNHDTSGEEGDLPIWVERMYAWLCAAACGENPPTGDLDAMAEAMTQAQALYGPLIRAGRPSPAVFKAPVLKRLARRVSKIVR